MFDVTRRNRDDPFRDFLQGHGRLRHHSDAEVNAIAATVIGIGHLHGLTALATIQAALAEQSVVRSA